MRTHAWCAVHSQLVYTKFIALDEDGRVACTGESDLDCPEPVEDSVGRLQVRCEEGHAWFTYTDD